MSSLTRQLPIFVYGTLQRGEERTPCWPHPPRQVDWATVRGQLFDLGPYPALTPGDDRILGELWWIDPHLLEETLDALDRVEGFNQPGRANWYVRKIVDCHVCDGSEHPAWTYLYGHSPSLLTVPPLKPDRNGLIQWHRFRDPIQGLGGWLH
jgi:gamma-glutamylcyclotransferase (GGCT)/AIG2-like uncharacterized protein YtfP